jgi:2',3'-cyclic-nucleotide 2'-phosphodiesterase / 3'-nucleotidase / 5'-nucleotidase
MLLPLLLALSTQAQDTAHIVVVSTTDVHGQATAWNYLADAPFPGGLSRAARVVDSLRARHPGQVVLLDAGDLIQGSPFTTYFARIAPQDPHPVLDVMGAMGYDAATPGNHEFNFGVAFMFRALRSASFPYVSGNIYSLPQDTLAFPAHTVVQRGGIRIGVTGFTTPGVMVWDRENLRGRARVARLGETAPRVLRQLDGAADFTIVLLHAGLGGASSYDTTGIGPEHDGAALARGPVKPDLVIAGHTHRELADTVINGVHFVQPGNFAQSLSVVHVTLQRGDRGWNPTRIRTELIPLGRVEPLPSMVRRLEPEHDVVRRWLAQPLANVSADMPATTARAEPTPIINYLNEVQRRKAGTDLSATAVFDNRAIFRAGEVTVAQVAQLYPYENTLRGIRISGQQLKDFLEHSARYYVVDPAGRVALNDSIPGYNFDVVSGAEYAVDLRLPVGSRIRGLSVRGRPVEPGDQFTMAVNSYRQAGGGGYSMLAGAPVVYDRGENVRDLLIQDLRARGVLSVQDFGTQNWRIVPEEAALAARRLFVATPDPVRPSPPRDTTLLRILALNDFHGALFSTVRTWSNNRPVGGMPAIKRLMDSLTALCSCPDLRLDAGDEMQGTLASNLEFGRSTVAAMNLLGIDAAVVGNHDFDWSVDTLLRRMADARYPWLLANVVETATGRRPDWAIPYRILTTPRLKVGVVGYLTPETNTIVRGDILQGLRITGPETLAEPLAQLRAEGPDLVVVLAHEGASCEGGSTGSGVCDGPIVDLARGLDSNTVHLIVAGHRHRLTNIRVNGIPIVQAGSSGGDIAVVDVVKTLVGTRELRTRLVAVYADSIGADSAMQVLVEGYRLRSDTLARRVVATLKSPANRSGGQYPLANLVADAHRNALRADFAIMNNGGVRTSLPAGPVNYAQVFEVSPFQNELVRIRLTGKDMKGVLEQALSGGRPDIHLSGLRVFYDGSRPVGSRVREVRLPTGRRMEDRATYTLAINDFLAGGKEGFAMLPALNPERTGIVDTDALVNYLRRLPQPVELPADERFVARK